MVGGMGGAMLVGKVDHGGAWLRGWNVAVGWWHGIGEMREGMGRRRRSGNAKGEHCQGNWGEEVWWS